VLSDFTVVDLETTGLDPLSGRITEIAAQRYRNGKLAGALAVLVWAGVEPGPDAVKLNGLTAEKLDRHGLPEADCINNLLLLLGSSVLVAHNASFEASWIHQASLRLTGAGFANDFLCTKTLAVSLLELRSYRLGALAELFGIPLENAHRAMPDVQATKALFDRLTSMPACTTAHLESLRNTCGRGRAHYAVQVGLPDHAKNIVQ
jgi:DNA polymerase III epsilon subunit-like protein